MVWIRTLQAEGTTRAKALRQEQVVMPANLPDSKVRVAGGRQVREEMGSEGEGTGGVRHHGPLPLTTSEMGSHWTALRRATPQADTFKRVSLPSELGGVDSFLSNEFISLKTKYIHGHTSIFFCRASLHPFSP